jgi:hypothetical protein
VQIALNNAYFEPSVYAVYIGVLNRRTAVYGSVRNVVWEGGVAKTPLSRLTRADAEAINATFGHSALILTSGTLLTIRESLSFYTKSR